MHHVKSHDGCTVAVSETKSIARLASRIAQETSRLCEMSIFERLRK